MSWYVPPPPFVQDRDRSCPADYHCARCAEVVCVPCGENVPDCPHANDLGACCRLDGCYTCAEEASGGEVA